MTTSNHRKTAAEVDEITLLTLRASSELRGDQQLDHYDWDVADAIWALLSEEQIDELDALLEKVNEFIHKRLEE